ncbi:MAG: AmmeMemoRadiSam system protein B [Desulfovibrio sp.]|uniref:AmmeMemoRadiSam system protein B n=1 Tax=Desulfovibrio sp. 7SRBS1 TaxID=3378064 RepID=UPI003B3E5FF9
MQRKPIVAGQFYPGDEASLRLTVKKLMPEDGDRDVKRSLLVMVPHAGYMYSGGVMGLTLSQANLAGRCILMGPNHTGRGVPLSVWTQGSWQVPTGELAVDEALAAGILSQVPGAEPDVEAHMGEHSLEVLCPFLLEINPAMTIVPICVALRSAEALFQTGMALGKLLAAEQEPVTIVVSSDMSHYISAENAREQDGQALANVVSLNAQGLLETVVQRQISMCGVQPMVVGMLAAMEMGASAARITGYSTSGDVTGDNSSVVGYAGAIIS